MKPLNLVLAQADAQNAVLLAENLQSHFKGVSLARDLEEIRRAVVQNRADVAVIDLEMASLSAIDQLRREFRNLEIVCTHRLADERLWSAALGAALERWPRTAGG